MMNNDLSNYNYKDDRIDPHDDNFQKRVSGYSLFDRDEQIVDYSYFDKRESHDACDDIIYDKVTFLYRNSKIFDTSMYCMLFDDTNWNIPYS